MLPAQRLRPSPKLPSPDVMLSAIGFQCMALGKCIAEVGAVRQKSHVLG